MIIISRSHLVFGTLVCLILFGWTLRSTTQCVSCTSGIDSLIVFQSAASQLQWKDLLDAEQISRLRILLRDWKDHGFSRDQILHLTLQMVFEVQKRFCLHGPKILNGCFDGGAGVNQLSHYFRIMEEHQKQRRLMKDAPVYCETGFNYGGSALTALLAGYNVYSFDVQAHPYSKASLQLLETLFPGKITLVKGDSAKTLKAFPNEHPQVHCDVVSVDGCHSKAYVVGDVEFFQMFTVPDNILLVDDTGKTYNGGEIRQAWEGLKRKKTIEERVCVDSGVVETMRGPRDLGYCIGTILKK